MPTISLRISEEEKKKLKEHGDISQVVRDAIRFYINSKKAQKTIKKLKELQEKYKLKTSKDDLMFIKKDRMR
jgi:hypothetical protein